ncbi:MAG: helix-turn-helix domain-containing protein [Betaproteobacteria bacterium]
MSTGAVDRMLLKVSEAAEALGISRSHAYELIQAGKLPVVRLGGAVRVPKPWIEKFVAEQVARWEGARGEL